MNELWQLYDIQGRPLDGRGGSKDEVFSKGLLHSAAHVWIWRNTNVGYEILLQKRAANKRTWPNLYDISSAGHVDIGESPITAALRETKEEIGITVKEEDLKLISMQRAYMVAPDGSIENEFQWLYLLHLNNKQDFVTQEIEVDSVKWKSIAEFKTDIEKSTNQYVPHGSIYYQTVISAIELNNIS